MDEESARPSSSAKQRKNPAAKRERKRDPTKAAGIVLKILEILGGFVCLGLLRYYYLLYAYESRLYLGIITTGGFILISGVLLLGSFMKGGNAPMQEAIINLLGAAMYIATGATSIDLYLRFWTFSETTRVGLVFGGLCVGIGILYLIDTWVALRRKPDDDDY